MWRHEFRGALDVSDLAVDSKGNVIVTGGFEGTIQIDSVKLASRGGLDIYLAKFDRNGRLLWIRSYGSPGGREV